MSRRTRSNPMSLTVHLSGHLKPYSSGQVEIVLPGDFQTVADALRSIWKQHPALRDRVLTEVGEIRTHVNVFVGGENVKQLKGLATQIRSKEVYIFNAVSGG